MKKIKRRTSNNVDKNSPLANWYYYGNKNEIDCWQKQ